MRNIVPYFAVLAFMATLFAGTSGALAGSFMPTTGIASQPVGHFDFCKRFPAECRPNAKRAIVKLTDTAWKRLVAVNEVVNGSIAPRTDEDMYGVPELWSYPTSEGDCEDYVLEKQRELEKAGLPASALLITVVRQLNGSGHAVLTVRTDEGDVILDNLDDRILPWDATPYTYVKRQSEQNAGRWVGIEDNRDVLVGSVR